MTAKEKAIELMDKYWELDVDDKAPIFTEKCKQCVLIAVDEILESQPRYPSEVDWDDAGGTHKYYYQAQREEAEKFWKEVKQEIERL